MALVAVTLVVVILVAVALVGDLLAVALSVVPIAIVVVPVGMAAVTLPATVTATLLALQRQIGCDDGSDHDPADGEGIHTWGRVVRRRG